LAGLVRSIGDFLAAGGGNFRGKCFEFHTFARLSHSQTDKQDRLKDDDIECVWQAVCLCCCLYASLTVWLSLRVVPLVPCLSSASIHCVKLW